MRAMVTVLIVSLMPQAATAADNKSIAREAFREGTRQYDLADYAKALELFKKAYLNYEEPVILFNIAQCERQLGEKSEAVKLYRSYLRKIPDALNRAEVERIIQRLEVELAQEQATKKTRARRALAPLRQRSRVPISRRAAPDERDWEKEN